MRYPVTTLGLLAIAVLLAMIIAPYFLPAETYEARLRGYIAAQTGYELRVAGETRLSLSPLPELTLTNVRLRGTGAKGYPELIDIAELRIGLSPMVLWSQAAAPRWVAAKGATLDIALTEELMNGVLRAPPDLPRLRWSQSRIALAGDFAASLIVFDEAQGHFSLTGDTAETRSLTLQSNARIDGVRVDAGFTLETLAAPIAPVTLIVKLGDDFRLAFAGERQSQAQESEEKGVRVIGEVALRDDALAPSILARLGLRRTARGRQRTEVLGVVEAYGDAVRVRNLQIDTLDMTGTGAVVFRRAPNSTEEAGVDFDGHVTVSELDLDSLALQPSDSLEGVGISIAPLMTRFFGQLAGRLNMKIGRVHLNDETSRNLDLDMLFDEEAVTLNRIQAELPHGTVLAQGVLRLPADIYAPAFDGELTLHTARAPETFAWIAGVFDYDIEPLFETADLEKLQRVSLNTAVAWEATQFQIRNLRGRINNTPYLLDLDARRVNDDRVVDIRLDAARFDLNDWGLLDTEQTQARQGLGALPFARWSAALLGFETTGRVQFQSANVYAGATHLGAVQIDMTTQDETLKIELDLPNYLDTAIATRAVLAHDGRQLTGTADMRFTSEAGALFLQRFARYATPLRPDFPNQFDLTTRVSFSGEGDPIWPATHMKINGKMGALELGMNFVSAERDFELLSPGAKMEMVIAGAQKDIRQLIGLFDNNSTAQNGRLSTSLNTQTRGLSELKAELVLGDDRVRIDGTLSDSQAGAEVAGQARLELGNTPNTAAPNMSIAAQVNWNAQALTFSNLNGAIDTNGVLGQITGEGVVAREAPRPTLTANLLVTGLDSQTLLPHQSTADTPFDWSLLGVVDANLSLRFVDLHIGDFPLAVLDTKLRVIDGILESERFELDWLDGTLSGAIQAEGGALTPSFALAGNFDGLEPSRIFQTLYKTPLVSGATGGSINMQMRGKSFRDMLLAASGAVTLETPISTLHFVDAEMPTQRARLAIAADMRKGIVTIKNGTVAFESAAPPAQLSGAINLNARRMTYQLLIPLEGETVDYSARGWFDKPVSKIARSPAQSAPPQ